MLMLGFWIGFIITGVVSWAIFSSCKFCRHKDQQILAFDDLVKKLQAESEMLRQRNDELKVYIRNRDRVLSMITGVIRDFNNGHGYWVREMNRPKFDEIWGNQQEANSDQSRRVSGTGGRPMEVGDIGQRRQPPRQERC